MTWLWINPLDRPNRKCVSPHGLQVNLREIDQQELDVVSVTYSERDGYLIFVRGRTVVTLNPVKVESPREAADRVVGGVK